MCKKLAVLLCLGLGAAALTSAPASGAAIDIRITAGADDFEEQLPGGNMDSGSSDLEIPYESAGTPVGTTEQVIGMRFTPVPVAKGAQIIKAYLELEMDEAKGNAQAVNVIIEGQLIANAPAFTTASKNITSRTATKAQVKWTIPLNLAVNAKFQSPDISPILNEIMSQDGWASGNALVLMIRDDKGNPSAGIRCVEAVEGEATAAPLLHIQIFDPAASAPSPANGAVGVTMPLLNWTKGDDAIFHNVYFGTTPDLTAANLVAPNQPFAMYFHVPGLEAGVTYYWRVDEVDATMKVTTGAVWSFTAEPITAYAPKPADGAQNLFPGPTLSWAPGKLAIKHQVFFSSVPSDVESGAAVADKGTVTDTKLNAGVLRSSTTYYWRVDEILADGKVNKGPVWSFATADGVSRKVVRQWWSNIAGGAVTDLTNNANYPNNPTGTELLDAFEGPVNWADYYGSRLYGWLIPPETADYTFWMASDDYGELRLSTDADPANAKPIATVPGWTNSQEWAKYPAQKSALVKLEAGKKYFIQAVMKEGSGGDNIAISWQGGKITSQQIIKAEYVDTFALPPLTAFSPSPGNGQADAPQDGALSWSAGEKAQKHDVYFGDDKAAVAAADSTSPVYKGQQTGTTFNAGELEWGKTYYWRVDEVNPAEAGSPWKGAVWSFTAATFMAVEDFESYTDQAGEEIFTAWIDGFTNGTNGSTVGYMTATKGTFGETTVVHGGKQSMPLAYDNSKSPFYSEAEQTFAPLQNWTSNGVTDLSLWVQGRPVAFVDKGNEAFTVGASGHDIWDNADDFRFVYKKLSGDGSVTVKVESLVNTNAWAKAGVMIRDTLDAGSPMAYMIQSFSSGASFGWRLTASATCGSATQTGIVAPQWVKLTRTGNAFTAQYSADGKSWTDIKNANGQVVSTTIMMGSSVYIGLCVTSHNTGATTTAEFSGAATTGGVSGAWQQAWIGDDPDRTNGTAKLYVAVEDSAGKVATASDPTLANTAAWTQWKIPLSSFTGVNLAKVKKLYIGVGDKKNPAADGSGLVFIDDIRVTKP